MRSNKSGKENTSERISEMEAILDEAVRKMEMKTNRIIKYLLIISAVIIMTTGCEKIGQVMDDSEKLDEYIEISRDKTEELIKNYAGKAKQKLKDQVKKELAKQDGSAEPGILSGTEDISLTDLTGAGTDYAFIYDGNAYAAKYTPDNWEITDSYKITNAMDMAVICQALIDVHPIHGRDMVSFRTADDMAYEWSQHNVIYELLSIGTQGTTSGSAEEIRGSLPEYGSWIDSVKDVDFDPEDQGKSYKELYEDRTGKKLDIKEILGI